MIGIVVALFQEAKNVIDKLNAKKSTALNGKDLYFGTFCNKDFALIISGIGKVNAALATQFLLDKYPIDYIINFGSVGGVGDNVKIRDYYAVDKCCQYDFDLSALDNVPIGYIQDYDSVYFYPKTDKLAFLPVMGLATSDRFTAKESDIKTVLQLNCEIFDMEGGAIAEVCTANNVSLYMFKGITDKYGSGNGSEEFYKNLNAVRDGFYPILLKMIENE